VDRGSARKAVVIAAAVVALALTAWAAAASSAPAPMLGVVVARGGAALRVLDQSSASGVLIVNEVRVPGDSWVVVTIPETPGSPARVVGYTRVPGGESRNVSIALEPGFPLSQKVVVTVHADRGVPGRFEFDAVRFDASPDKPLYVEGVPVSATVVKDTALRSLASVAEVSVSQDASASAGRAVIEVAGRLTVINALVVDRVVAPGPSWVAVYLVGADGAPGALAGVVSVASGETLGVTVPITIDAPLTDKVLVALHVDAGVAGRFEFDVARFGDSPDKPYAVDGVEVSRGVLLRGYGMSNDNMIDSGAGGM
jgi:hypothetical protein